MNSAFWRWFGNSKVVNPDGSPKIVFHGTSDARGLFETTKLVQIKRGYSKLVYVEPNDPDAQGPGFRERWKSVDSLLAGRPVFFATDSYQMADSYTDFQRAADREYAEPSVVPLYLSIQNPLIVDAQGQSWRKVIKRLQEASALGYDGVIFLNVVDYLHVASVRPRQKPRPGTVYAFFSPTQAKSALMGPLISRESGEAIRGSGPNDGTWDADDPDLRSNPVPLLLLAKKGAHSIAKSGVKKAVSQQKEIADQNKLKYAPAMGYRKNPDDLGSYWPLFVGLGIGGLVLLASSNSSGSSSSSGKTPITGGGPCPDPNKKKDFPNMGDLVIFATRKDFTDAEYQKLKKSTPAAFLDSKGEYVNAFGVSRTTNGAKTDEERQVFAVLDAIDNIAIRFCSCSNPTAPSVTVGKYEIVEKRSVPTQSAETSDVDYIAVIRLLPTEINCNKIT